MRDHLLATAYSPLLLDAANSTDAVIVMGWGYRLTVYSGFAVSLRRTGFAGDVLILGLENAQRPDNAEKVRAWSSRWRVSFVPVPKMAYPTLERFGMFATACRDGGYRRCLVGDMRDVYFQTDPFERLTEAYPGSSLPDLVIPMEIMPVKTCWNNGYPTCVGKRLMETCFGGASLWKRHADKRLSEQPTLCARAQILIKLSLHSLSIPPPRHGKTCEGSDADLLHAILMCARQAQDSSPALPRGSSSSQRSWSQWPLAAAEKRYGIMETMAPARMGLGG